MTQILFLVLTLSLALTAAPAKKKHIRGTVPLPVDLGAKVPGTTSATAPTPVGRPAAKSPSTEKSENPSIEQVERSQRKEPGELGKCERKQSLETYIQISSASRPQAPPQGGVYFISDLRETPQLFYQKASGQWPTQMTFFPDGVPYFRVSPDGEKILVATHQGGDEQYNIYLLEPRQALRLTPLIVDRQSRVESVAWSSDSKWFAYTSNARNKTDMDLYKFELRSGKSELLAELNGSHNATDVSPDGKKITVTNYRSVTDSDVLIWDLATKTSIRIAKKAGDSRDYEGMFTADSKNILYLSDATGGISQLHLHPLAEGKATKLLSSGKWGVEDFTLGHKRNEIAMVINEEGYGRLEGYELDIAGRKKRNLLLPSSPRTIASSPSFGPRANLFFAQTSSTQSSDIWEWRGDRRTQWTKSSQGWMDADCLSREELVHYVSFDGKTIPAFLYLPPDAKGPVPFVVSVHGGPESQYRPAFSRLFQYLLSRGFGVFAPNVRGSLGYGREYTRLDNYKLRMDSVKDLIAGAKWLLSSRYSTPGKLAITGGSYGGFMVLRAIQVEPDLFSAAAESVGITNFVTFLKNTKPYRRALREVEYGPLSDEEFLASISPMTYLEQIKTPLLIFHGANDPRVPVSEAEQVIAALKKRDIPVEFKIFPDEGHGNAKLRNIMEQAQLTTHFFEKHMGSRSVSTSPPASSTPE